jgi:hypothetical protein
MRKVSLVGALCVLFWPAVQARGQAGRYIPVPRLPGGGGSALPQIPFFPEFGSDFFWVIVAIAGVIVLAVLGWALGEALGGRKTPPGSHVRPPPCVPPLEDLILQPDEVEEKARATTRLLKALAQCDAAFDPSGLRAFITATFTRVQQCWEARDYGPVRALLSPSILAEHEELLRAMRRNREINRIEDLRVRWLEFVHVWCPAEAARHEVTALITFEAKVYFVRDRNGAFLRGSQKVIPYQEFWIFRRHGDRWQLASIDRHESDRLEAANRVDGMRDVDRRNAEQGVIVL